MEEDKGMDTGHLEKGNNTPFLNEGKTEETESRQMSIFRDVPIGSSLLLLYTIFFIAYTCITGLFNQLMALILLFGGVIFLRVFTRIGGAFSFKKLAFSLSVTVFALLTYWQANELDLDEKGLNYTVRFGHNMDKPAEYCEIHFDNGDIYKGGWIKDENKGVLPHGKGKLYYRANDKWDNNKEKFFFYKGNYHYGERHGQGAMYQRFVASGGSFVRRNGEWVETPKKYVYKLIYNGQWVESDRSGKGKSLFYNEKGQLTSTYEGEYKDNTRHGFGTMKFYLYETENLYEMHIGTYVNGDREGKGSYYWLNKGTAYKGDFLKDKRTGYGSYYDIIRKDTANLRIRYTGQWKDGEYHGHGKLYKDDGKTVIYEGEFKNGKEVK